MTWKQWKEEVEAQGVKDTTDLSYIDVDGDCHPLVNLRPETPSHKEYAKIYNGKFVGEEEG